MAADTLTRISSALAAAANALRAANNSFAVVGGLAVSARTEPRFTRDVDLAVSADTDSDAEDLVRALQTHGFHAIASIEHQSLNRLSTARLIAPGEQDDGVVVDLLFASSGIEHEVVVAAEPLEVLPGIIVRLAVVGHLIALKTLSRSDKRRPQDIVDLRALLAIATPDDLHLARESLTLITSRGFNRHRDVAKELEMLISESD